jgi:hypothetical protein
MASHSTTDPLILAVYPSKPAGADLEAFRAAKASMGIERLIQPVRGVQGSPFRIIALRERPDFICDYDLVKNPTPASIQAAMEWALSESPDSRATTVLDMLKEIFGEGIRELGRGS